MNCPKRGLSPWPCAQGKRQRGVFLGHSCQKPKTFPDTPEGHEAQNEFPIVDATPLHADYESPGPLHQGDPARKHRHLERAGRSGRRTQQVGVPVRDRDGQPRPTVRSRRPLRMASVSVGDVDGNPGWYQVELRARPHFKYMGASFTLSLVGKSDISTGRCSRF